ncbi:hypothetical protein H1S01_05690 [Heliobacterium chlorum]|uniref:Uncharacterized protein n=1 Tax=Heliobacterium chlorum TaxID=2698 RepID=A0ABR7SZN1_HELCL|nr:hypothetical protein [Heliobacterium chlorum]MBC9784003.1 hypothetical protein [Heliobacterium chlorum]
MTDTNQGANNVQSAAKYAKTTSDMANKAQSAVNTATQAANPNNKTGM